MSGINVTLLWAVHLSDGTILPAWQVGGYLVAGLLALFGAWRVRDEEIPQIAVLTAAFFTASQIHLGMGPTSVHLILNGLVGVILGRRACLAIPIGLALQAALFLHGGFSTLGVNICVMTFPALAAAGAFAFLRQLPWQRHAGLRAGFVAVTIVTWTLCLVYSGTLLFSLWSGGTQDNASLAAAIESANRIAFHPLALLAACLLAVAAAVAERRLEHAPEFPLGLFLGSATLLLTLLLHCFVLNWGGQEDWTQLVVFVFVIHLPIVAIEGAILGFTLGYLAQVKPEMIGWPTPEKVACAVESAP